MHLPKLPKKEGFGTNGLQKGLFLAYPYTTLMNGTRLGCYPTAKTTLAQFFNSTETSYLVSCLAGGITGVIGTMLANPFYVAKTRLQAQVKLDPTVHASVGHQHSYTSAWDALISIGKQEGIRGYFRGLSASCYRIFVASAVQLATYDYAKRFLLHLGFRDNIGTHLESSILSSLALVVVLNPFDVILTRLQNQPVVDGKGQLYKNWGDCFIKSARTEGLYGFYKGTIPHYGRLAPHTVALFLFLEQSRKLFHRYEMGYVD